MQVTRQSSRVVVRDEQFTRKRINKLTSLFYPLLSMLQHSITLHTFPSTLINYHAIEFTRTNAHRVKQQNSLTPKRRRHRGQTRDDGFAHQLTNQSNLIFVEWLLISIVYFNEAISKYVNELQLSAS